MNSITFQRIIYVHCNQWVKVITKIMYSPCWNPNYPDPRYIKIQEAAYYQVRLLQKAKNFMRYPLKEPDHGYTTISTIEALLADESGRQRQTNKRCIYCEGDHYSDEWLRYANIQVRRNKLKNWCFICFKDNHKAKHGKASEKPCVHCEEYRKHHRSLCPKSFQWRAQWKNRKKGSNSNRRSQRYGCYGGKSSDANCTSVSRM